jgi:hypothetical protein
MEKNLPRFWWINQGKKFKEESEGGYFFAPSNYYATGAAGARVKKVYNMVSQLYPGDIVVNSVKGPIPAVSIVTEQSVIRARPGDLYNGEQGFFVKANYRMLNEKLNYHDLPLELRLSEPKVFTSQGYIMQVYICPLTLKFVEALVSLYPTAFPEFLIKAIDEVKAASEHKA